MINYTELTLTIPYPSIDFVLCYLIVGSLYSMYTSTRPGYNGFGITLAGHAIVVIVWLPVLAYFKIKGVIGND
jgi:hypothetical protein